MQVHSDPSRLPQFRRAVITIGTFDGVHNGHRQIIETLQKEARRIDGETVIITFHPHPRKVVSSTILGVRLINTLDEKRMLLEQLGIDHLVVVPFTDAFANQEAESYVADFLVKLFNPHSIIIGYDHRFGRGRKGDYQLLEQLAPKYNYELLEIPRHVLNEIAVSSTRIRESLLEGRQAEANRLLGYPFFFCGQVVHGDKLGRKLGYPTANLRVLDEEKIIPANGIYAVTAALIEPDQQQLPDNRMKGMMSIGFRPTVDGRKRVIEVNLFDFASEIYDQHLIVFVEKYLRAEIKFDTLDDLIKQMEQDKLETLELF
ncbi:MAG: bifunctional riboflavin kinase/FAD synthetase [Chitinophagaceae bacterium]|nr:bifunctional riboflavin kinase/FAD synthetase [Chitinophagaceae bacterium]